MSKQHLIDAVYDATNGITKSVIATVIDELGSAAAHRLAKGEDVALPFIGKLSIVQRSERKGRNPHTGEQITIAAKSAVKFKPDTRLRRSLA